jgi:hypothetical protein
MSRMLARRARRCYRHRIRIASSGNRRARQKFHEIANGYARA